MYLVIALQLETIERSAATCNPFNVNSMKVLRKACAASQLQNRLKNEKSYPA
jgi:hypothetical protein